MSLRWFFVCALAGAFCAVAVRPWPRSAVAAVLLISILVLVDTKH